MSEQTDLAVAAPASLRSIMRSEQIVTRFEEITGKNHAGGYISSVLLAASQNEALQRCHPNSIIASALRAATMELSVDPATGQAYLVPFGNKATLIVGYKGLYHMAIRTGKYRFINVITIYEADELTENIMTGIYQVKRHGGKGEKVAGYMLYFQLISGYEHTFYMTVDECEEHGAKYSKTYSLPTGLWKKDPHAMYKKTVIRMGLTKWGYLDPHDMMSMNDFDESETDYIDGIEIKEMQRQSVDQNLAALGFGSDEPAQPETEPESGVMTYEQACNVISSSKQKYGTMTNKDLQGRKFGLEKKMRENLTVDQQNECQNKLEAIKILLFVSEADRLKATGQKTIL